jgi:hypothetical protein
LSENECLDLFSNLIPLHTLVPQFQDLLCGGGIRGTTDRTDADAGPLEVLAHRAPTNAQLGTDLAQGPAMAYKSAAR